MDTFFNINGTNTNAVVVNVIDNAYLLSQAFRFNGQWGCLITNWNGEKIKNTNISVQISWRGNV